MHTSCVIDASMPERIAGGGAGGTTRTAAKFLFAGLPAIAVAVAGKHFLLNPRSSLLGWGISVLVAVVVAIALIGLFTAVARLSVGRVLGEALAAQLPVGGTLAADYYDDRVVTTINGAVPNTVPYSSITGMRVHKDLVILDRGPGSAAFPLVLVPPDAQALLRSRLSSPQP